MPKSKIIISFVLFILISKLTIAQNPNVVYQIKSLDGTNKNIHVMHQIADGILKISYLKDTITISEFMDLEGKIKILDNHFLEIIYQVRSGSDEDSWNVILLDISKNKLFETLNTNYLNTYIAVDGNGINKLDLTLRGDNKLNYKLNVDIHDKVYSKSHPETNYNYNNRSVLRFDYKQNVFYSVKKDVYDTFAVYDMKAGKEIKQQIKGNFPTVILEDAMYYCIKGEWYGQSRQNHLFKYSDYN
jgi:hypothetical protein